MKPLDSKQLRAALLRHQGSRWKEIATALGVGLSTAKSWATLPAFKAEVERLKKGEQVRGESELSAALDQRLALSKRLWTFCNARIDEIEESAQAIPQGSRWRQLPGLTKSLAEIVKLTLETEAAALGLETIASDLDAIAQQTT